VASFAGFKPLAGNAEAKREDLVQAVARKALLAARTGFTRAKRDETLAYTFYLLTQVALASREDNWTTRLKELGVSLGPTSSIIDLTTEFHNAVDHFLRAKKSSSDIGEMAQRAAGDAITPLAGTHAQTLFGETGGELRLAVRSLSTKKGFGELSQQFFGRLTSRFLNFFLSRITASKAGGASLQQVGDISAFNRSLEFHCVESSRIVRDFAAEWYSKTQHQKGSGLTDARAFVAVALQKVVEELR